MSEVKKIQVDGVSYDLGGGSGLSDDAKNALLDCFAHVAWIDEDGQDYYDALQLALFPPASLVSISAIFEQGAATIYDTDTLDTLKQYLTVTANYDDGTSAEVTLYTLSGTLTVGTSTITVAYGGKTTTFDVSVTEYVDPTLIYSLYNQTFTSETTPVNTEVAFLQNDRDITFVFDTTWAGLQPTGFRMFQMMNGTSPYFGFNMQSNSGGSQLNMPGGGTIIAELNSSFNGNFKLIITHASGSGKWRRIYKVNDNAIVDATNTSSFSSITAVLGIAGTSTGLYKWYGTMNKALVYSRVLSSDEINELMGQ